uniref:UPF0126 domain-containing protein n=1 Tax=Macrostomum lignano TaxID=282301 RepID=A0A1I8F5E2_9PLAT
RNLCRPRSDTAQHPQHRLSYISASSLQRIAASLRFGISAGVMFSTLAGGRRYPGSIAHRHKNVTFGKVAVGVAKGTAMIVIGGASLHDRCLAWAATAIVAYGSPARSIMAAGKLVRKIRRTSPTPLGMSCWGPPGTTRMPQPPQLLTDSPPRGHSHLVGELRDDAEF